MAEVFGASGPQSRRVVASMGRAELEDKHMSLLDENHLLKKHARSQEEKMKKMATKLLRLAADERREARRDGQPASVVRVRELEGEIEELVSRIRDMERNNTSLQNKVAVLRQQSESKGRRRTPYDHVQSRTSSGLGRRGQQRSMSTEDVCIRRGPGSSPTTPRYGRSLLEEARRDNQELEDLVLRLKQEAAVLTTEAQRNQQQMRLQAAEHVQQVLSLEQQLKALTTAQQKHSIEGDVEVIRVQREVREKSDQLLVLQAKYSALEKNLEAMRTNHSKLLKEIEQLNSRLKEEQTRSVELQAQLHASTVSQSTVTELQQLVHDLRAENDILKKSNDRLMKSSSHVEERGSEYRSELRTLQDRIRELEASRDQYLQIPNTHLLSSEIKVSEHGRSLQTSKLKAQEVMIDTGCGSSDTAHPQSAHSHNIIETQGKYGKTDLQRELSELRMSRVDTAVELEKTRQLLAAQRSVNQDYKKEVEVLRVQVCQLQSQQHWAEHGRLSSDAGGQPLYRHRNEDQTQQAFHRSPLLLSSDHCPPLTPPSVHTASFTSHSSHKAHPHTTLHSSQRAHPHTPPPSLTLKRAHPHSQDTRRKEVAHSHTRDHRNEEIDSGNKNVLMKRECAETAVSNSPYTRPLNTSQPVSVELPARVQSTGETDKQPHQTPPGNGESGSVEVTGRGTGNQLSSQVTSSVQRVSEVIPQTTENIIEQVPTSSIDGGSQEENEEDSIGEDISESVSLSPDSEKGTPSTSTPLRPPFPTPSYGGSSHDSVPPLPPLSSSLSVIAEPPPVTEPEEVEGRPREGGREGRRGGRGGGKGGELGSLERREGGERVSGGDGRTAGVVMRGEEGVGGSGDSVSVTVTEISDYEEEEDTMFEETLPHNTTESIVSGRTLTTPTHPSVRLASDDEEESPLVSPSLASDDEYDERRITPHQEEAVEDVMSLAIERFTVEPGSSLVTRDNVSGYFVEFQLLDYDYGELETQSVVTSPHSTQPVLFNFKTEFCIGSSQKALLSSALSSTTDSPDTKVTFTLVSDPVDQSRDCEEVGTAELDLASILQSGEDVVSKNVEVISCAEDSELLGHLTVSLNALHILRQL